MKTTEKSIYSICEEIHELQKAVEYHKNLYETVKATNNQILSDSLVSTQKSTPTNVMFFMTVLEDEKGNLVFKKENRKLLVEKENDLILGWAVALQYKSLSVHELVENAKLLIEKLRKPQNHK